MSTSGDRRTGFGAHSTERAGHRRWRIAAAALAAGFVLLSAGCGDGKSGSSWQGDGKGGSGTSAPQPSTVAVTAPAANAKDVVASTDIKYATEDPANTTVVVKSADGDAVTGTLDKDGKVFHPAKALSYGATYTVTVTGTASGGKTGTASSTFTTMSQPTKLIRASSFLGDDQTVGIGMPVIMKFGRSIPVSARATVERRMVVTASPAQVGTWHWISPTEVHWRPQTYWKAYSKVHVAVNLAGVPLGDSYYGRSDLTVDFNIGRALTMNVVDSTKMMTVKQDGKTIKTIPVSLGKPSTPSWSGTMLVIEKKLHTVFDTTATDPDGGYKDNIDFAQRITWSGSFVHAAPWSEGVQGKVNVSHGCVNVSEALGKWLFDRTLVGDPVTVTGTGTALKNGNGWTDWNMSWDQYKKGSYLTS
jgi:lipoprotein-anchoring transpeptidase ErfK/SrfK